MRFSIKSMALVSGLLWGGCLFFVGLANLVMGSYGADFLRDVSSVYPGFHESRTFADVVVGTVYGFADGAIGGSMFGWLYNTIARRTS